MAISDWPEDQRPRERLMTYGPQALSDQELLAVFLRTGVQGKNALDLGREKPYGQGSDSNATTRDNTQRHAAAP